VFRTLEPRFQRPTRPATGLRNRLQTRARWELSDRMLMEILHWPLASMKCTILPAGLLNSGRDVGKVSRSMDQDLYIYISKPIPASTIHTFNYQANRSRVNRNILASNVHIFLSHRPSNLTYSPTRNSSYSCVRQCNRKIRLEMSSNDIHTMNIWCDNPL